MSYSLQRATSDGTLSTIPVNILYFDKTDLAVYVDDVVLPDGTYTYSWSANNIVITPNVANGSEVLIKRSTKFDLPYHDFSAGAVFKDSTVDDNFKQMLFIAQETSEGATATDFYADLNLHGYRLRKVGNAVEPDDAVPFAQYQADALGAYQQRVLAESAKDTVQASQTAAASSASAASASASAASTSASAASTSATNASSSASSASTSATSAGTSAANAASSASAAATSETNAAASAAAAAASAASINDANLVHKTGAETVGGIKTFTSSPVLPGNATTALQAVPKQQLDSVSADVSALDTRIDTLEVDNGKRLLNLGTKSASGTAVTFSPADGTGIPSWAKKITIAVADLSTTTSAAFPVVQLGALDAGMKVTGYDSCGALITSSSVVSVAATAGFNISSSSGNWLNTTVVGGSIDLTLVDAATGTWSLKSFLGSRVTNGMYMCGGDVTMSDLIDRLRIATSDGVGTFDSGSITVLVEG